MFSLYRSALSCTRVHIWRRGHVLSSNNGLQLLVLFYHSISLLVKWPWNCSKNEFLFDVIFSFFLSSLIMIPKISWSIMILLSYMYTRINSWFLFLSRNIQKHILSTIFIHSPILGLLWRILQETTSSKYLQTELNAKNAHIRPKTKLKFLNKTFVLIMRHENT